MSHSDIQELNNQSMINETEQIRHLIERNDELENYFRNTIIPQLFVDADLKLRKFTPPAMKQFNLKGEDLGKSITDIKDNFRFPAIIENIQSVIETADILEKEIQTTDFRWYQMNIIPYITQKTKKANGVIITFVEITMRIKDLKQLESLIADHETLLDAISHDIKTPLTGMIAAIEVFKNSLNDQKNYKALIHIVESSILKMQVIVKDLTESRQKEHKYKAEEELLSFENIMEDVRLTLADLIHESGAEIFCDLKVSEIKFSRRKLRSIIFNLVNNAIKYTAPGHKPEIFIRTAQSEDFIVINVRDNGIGIERSKLANIFSKYYRVENNVSGSGIGLYLVKEQVTGSGGKIEVNSEPGKGSEFTVYLKN